MDTPLNEDHAGIHDYARAMAEYNQWMNQKILAACSTLSDAERKQDCGAFFKSIHGTLNHILLADRVWLARFAGSNFAFRSLDQELYAEFADLRSEREKSDREIIAWAGALTGPDLSLDLTYTSVVNPKKRSIPIWIAVAHLFNHQTHHRGQITTLLSQRGIEPGVTDFLWLPQFQTPD